ncbi:MAG: UDP-N-acetylmuramoyl-L-alanyl-D-glutamate--2,6-diaminopimelate ligase [Lachnospiraceae bacterium]|nr:UDP-N-acetylmuramoyl-L-alanyl-D-glutamate--2,6-diaminopimelate ligase [Lachnospiraceae bacterium]
MKTLGELAQGFSYTLLTGSLDTEVTGISYNSNQVEAGNLFVCIVGAKFDAHTKAEEIVQSGASVLVISRDVELSEEAKKRITILKTEDTRYALAFLSAAWFDRPADRLKVIGITGTKGKTTTTYLVKSILEQAGHKVGLVGTIEAIIGDERIPAKNTTPESYVLQEYFSRMEQAGCDIVVMEVSSQGLMQHRSQGFTFELGIFTNISPDHIGPNEHKDFDDYMRCKGLLFRQCRLGIINCDDPHWEEVTKGHTCELLTFGLTEDANLRAEDVRLLQGEGYLGVEFEATCSLSGKEYEDTVCFHAPGRFSVYNALTAIAICLHFGIKNEDIRRGLLEARVKGRIELVKVSDAFTLMIDYAHNAMALESLLTTLREYRPKRLICLFGCGGNRSRLRRYEMGEVSGKLADLTIITSDNPRDEDPLAIMADIRTGMEKTDGKYMEIADRREAIAYVIDHGQPGDVIVLAGKGHEDYQEIKGVKYPMDERVIIRDILANRK